MITGLFKAIGSVFTNKKDSEVILMGPIGMASELSRQRTFEDGIMSILAFAGLLSLNLGVVNLLPIPALDGGRLALIIAEKFVGRSRIAKVELTLNYIGMIFLLGLSALIAGNDIWRIFKGN